MKYTNKQTFAMALAHYISNCSEEIVDEVYNNDDWSNVILWEPFESWEINDIHELVLELQEDFNQIRNYYQ